MPGRGGNRPAAQPGPCTCEHIESSWSGVMASVVVCWSWHVVPDPPTQCQGAHSDDCEPMSSGASNCTNGGNTRSCGTDMAADRKALNSLVRCARIISEVPLRMDSGSMGSWNDIFRRSFVSLTRSRASCMYLNLCFLVVFVLSLLQVVSMVYHWKHLAHACCCTVCVSGRWI
jgi:hypothetical protein